MCPLNVFTFDIMKVTICQLSNGALLIEYQPKLEVEDSYVELLQFHGQYPIDSIILKFLYYS